MISPGPGALDVDEIVEEMHLAEEAEAEAGTSTSMIQSNWF